MSKFDTLAQEFINTPNPTRHQVKEMMKAASPTVVAARVYTDGRISIKEQRFTKKSTLVANLNRVFNKAKANHIDNYDKGLAYYETSLMHGKGHYFYTTIRIFRDLEPGCIGYPE